MIKKKFRSNKKL